MHIWIQLFSSKGSMEKKHSISHRSLRISGLLRLLFFILHLKMILLIILLHIVRTMSPELQPMAVQYTGHVITVCITWQRYCTSIDWSSGDVIRTTRTTCNYIINYIYQKCKIKIKNYNRSKPEILRHLWDIVVFKLVAYLLNMICLILIQIAYI